MFSIPKKTSSSHTNIEKSLEGILLIVKEKVDPEVLSTKSYNMWNKNRRHYDFPHSAYEIRKIFRGSGLDMELEYDFQGNERRSFWEIQMTSQNKKILKDIRRHNLSGVLSIRKECEKSLKWIRNNKQCNRTIFASNRYEDSINIVYETLKESLELLGCIEEELLDECCETLHSMFTAYEKVEEDKNIKKSLDEKTIKESLINRIKVENEYKRKFLDI